MTRRAQARVQIRDESIERGILGAEAEPEDAGRLESGKRPKSACLRFEGRMLAGDGGDELAEGCEALRLELAEKREGDVEIGRAGEAEARPAAQGGAQVGRRFFGQGPDRVVRLESDEDPCSSGASLHRASSPSPPRGAEAAQLAPFAVPSRPLGAGNRARMAPCAEARSMLSTLRPGKPMQSDPSPPTGAAMPPTFLEDKHAIEQIYVRYCELVDAKQFDRLGDCFTEDTGHDYTRSLPGITLEGLAPLIASMHWNLGDGSHCGATHHNVGNFRIQVDVDRARAKVNDYAVHRGIGRHEGALYSMWGLYDDELVRTKTGWRVARRVYSSILTEGPVVTSRDGA